jgi:Holliday junction resolvase RusA-like endonuclease
MLASGTIFAECASKSNSRRLVTFGERPASIKSEKALAFLQAKHETDKPFAPITEPIRLTCKLYYATRRPDLDAAMVMDWLQLHGVIKNDRQVFELVATKHIDKAKPRVEWKIEPFTQAAAA